MVPYVCMYVQNVLDKNIPPLMWSAMAMKSNCMEYVQKALIF